MSLDDPVIITCAISGALANREQCPAIPYTPQEYAAEARRIVDEGGAMIHIHARRPDGTPSYEVEDFAAIVGAIRDELGDDDVIVNLSTGAVGVPVAKRIAYLRALRPDVAALNMGSMNYAKYSRHAQGVRVLGGLRQPVRRDRRAARGDERARASGPSTSASTSATSARSRRCWTWACSRAPLHVDCVMGVTGGIPPTARNLAAMVDNIPAGAHWGVVGVSRVQWTLRRRGARARRLDPRRPGGQPLPARRDDGALQRRARRAGAADDRRRGPPAGDGRRGARDARGAAAMSAARPGRSAGVRVLDLSRLLPGGFCSLLLADYGADVLKVEDMGMGDYIRWAPPYVEGAAQSARSALFLALNRNKRSIRIDLKQDGGPRGAARARARARRRARVLPARACSTASASATRRCARSTRSSCCARSPATARTARCATAPGTT